MSGRPTKIAHLIEQIERNTKTFKKAISATQSNLTEILKKDTRSASSSSSLPEETQSVKAELEKERERSSRYREEAEGKIKKYLEEILELKGAIRVICRIKPTPRRLSYVTATPTQIALRDTGRSLSFAFFSVLPPSSTQEELFSGVEDLVLSATKGNRSSILAYGPTGSGKSYSMEGTETDPGVVSRSLAYIEECLRREKELGWSVQIKGRVLELYGGRAVAEKETSSGEMEEVKSLFRRASAERRVGSTECNARSSRTHLILSVEISMQREGSAQKETRAGLLRIVDLAGSERVKASKAEGERLKEAVEINKSLTALRDVICAIAEKSQHIPYRNSKLTHVLRDALGEGAKTAFIVSIDPSAPPEETATTLRFSRIIQECTLGKTQRNTQVTGHLN